MRWGPLGAAAAATVLLGAAGDARAAERIAFERGGDVWTMAPDGGDARALIATPEPEGAPSLSPDGTLVAFRAGIATKSAIVVASARDGSGARVVADAPGALDDDPEWSPDGSRLAFVSDRSGDAHVWTVRADGTEPLPATSGVRTTNVDPSWSPDGTRIVFATTRFSGQDLDLATMTPGVATSVVRVTSRSGPDRRPDWSPDGTRIAYATVPVEESPAVHSVRPDGEGDRPLFQSPGTDTDPAWSPTGAEVVLVTDTDPATGTTRQDDLLRVAADGSRLAVLTTTEELEAAPAWGTVADAPPPPPPPPPPPDGGTAGSTQTATTTAAQQQQQPPPPEPEIGEAVTARTLRGQVYVRVPGSARAVPLSELTRVPLGSVFDTRRGLVSLTGETDTTGTQSRSWFYDGVFRVAQGADGSVVVKLTETLSCPRARRSRGGRSRAAAVKVRKRRLWGQGAGRFRTTGKHSAATVRGTWWLVEDTCTSTTTRVREGVVAVRDFRRRRTVLVRAGGRYVARARPR